MCVCVCVQLEEQEQSEGNGNNIVCVYQGRLVIKNVDHIPPPHKKI